MKWPTIEQVRQSLIAIKRRTEPDTLADGLDVRLQVYGRDAAQSLRGGAWDIHTGYSQYDQDHRGFWGAAVLDRHSNCRNVARDLIAQARDAYEERMAVAEYGGG